jgi:enamine deaminase RidA (YjgF/YER057c/UK114 family)
MREKVVSHRQNISSGTPWESVHGYSRAVRIGNHVYVSGTTASDEQGNVFGENDPYEQTVYIIEKIARALTEAGASLQDVVRTRIFVTDISRWEEVAHGHAQYFQDIRPVSTMVEVNKLVNEKQMVEIEVDAIIGASR